MRTHRPRSTDTRPALTSSSLTSHAALPDHAPLKLCERTEQLQHQTPRRCRRVNRLSQTPKASAAHLNPTKYREQIGQTTSNPVDFVDHQHVARPKSTQGRIQLRTPRRRTTLFLEHPPHLRTPEGITLQCRLLFTTRDPRVANQHHHSQRSFFWKASVPTPVRHAKRKKQPKHRRVRPHTDTHKPRLGRSLRGDEIAVFERRQPRRRQHAPSLSHPRHDQVNQLCQ